MRIILVFILLAALIAPSARAARKKAEKPEAAEKTETDATKFAQQGVEASKSKDWNKAIEMFRKAMELDKKFAPNLVVAYQHRAFESAGQQKYRDAIADLTEALKINPQDVRTYEQRAAMEMRAKDYDKAAADYSQAIKITPDDITNYLYRGYVYELKGDKKNAMADTESALKIDPTNQEALDRKARLQVTLQLQVPFTPSPQTGTTQPPSGTP
jgi:tetratricopeptide (TPR) repeat protein